MAYNAPRANTAAEVLDDRTLDFFTDVYPSNMGSFSNYVFLSGDVR
jgi:hypothetical protein